MKPALEAMKETQEFRDTDAYRDLPHYLFELEAGIYDSIAKGMWGFSLDAPKRLHPALCAAAEKAGYYASASSGSRHSHAQVSVFWSEPHLEAKTEEVKPAPARSFLSKFFGN